ncbi:MAG TPA: aspartate aminotransferase family protein [Solirubrobacteraceae bacterium]|nr:aspartate aminotransferase family protein [Solirubrobacteraceae bacterium]
MSHDTASRTARDTAELQRAARDHLWSSFGGPGTYAEDEPIVLVRADGSEVFDSDGKRYLDGISALEAMVVGHGRPELAEVAAAQMNELAFLDLFRYSSVPAIELAERLAALTPGDLSRVFLTPGGAEADEVAIKIALQYHHLNGEPARQKILTRAGAFHGSTVGAMVLDGNYWATSNYIYEGYATRGRIVAPPACPSCDWGKGARHLPCPHRVEETIRAERPETVAAVVVDPAASAIAVAVPPPEYLVELRRICDEYGVLLIADEVITGFGRTGRMFCSDHSGVAPDLMTLSKGLSSGYAPIGATVVSERIAQRFVDSSLPTLRHGHTYGGHPVACAVALANLEIIERERLSERAAENGAYMLDGLWSLEHHPTFWDARGIGLLAGLELVADREGNDFDNPGVVGTRLRKVCRANGLITLPLHPGAVMFFAPPLVITRTEIDELVDVFDRSLTEVERELGVG